jgi:site-specific recombinase XerD
LPGVPVPDDIILDGEPYKRFLRGLNNSEATKRDYHAGLVLYMKFKGYKRLEELYFKKNPSELTEADMMKIEDSLEDFIHEMQAGEGLTESTVRTRLAGVRHFYDMNRIQRIVWDSVYKTITKTKKLKKRGYRAHELKVALDVANARMRAIVTCFTSTGMREAAAAELNVGNLIPLERYGINYPGYLVLVYKDTDDEYYTFFNAEARLFIDDYLNYRRKVGEELTDDSPLFREDFNRHVPEKVASPKRVTGGNIFQLVSDLMIRAGVRKVIKAEDPKKAGRIRHETKAVHGLRAFFDTAAKNAKIPEDFRRFLRGDDCGLDENYYDYENPESVRAVWAEYLKIIDNITIYPVVKLEKENELLKKELANTAPKDMIADMMLQQKQALDRMDAMQKQLYAANKEIVNLKRRQLAARHGKPNR